MRHITFLPVLVSFALYAGCGGGGGPTCESIGVPAFNDEYFTPDLVQSGSALNLEWTPADAFADEVRVESTDGTIIWHAQCDEEQEEPCIETGITTLNENAAAGIEILVNDDPEDGVEYNAVVAQYGVQCRDQERSGTYGPFTLSSGAP